MSTEGKNFKIQELTGFSLIKRCSWLAIKTSLYVVIPISILVVLGLLGLILYKSITLVVSLTEVIEASDNFRHQTNAPWYGGGFAKALLAVPSFVVVTALTCGVVGASIGALLALTNSLRKSILPCIHRVTL